MPGWDSEKTEWHYRVKDPGLFRKNTIRSKDLKGIKGVRILIGRLKRPPKGQEGSAVTQAYLFDKKVWDLPRAKAWMKKHRRG